MALATAVVRSYCLDHGLAYSLVATQRTIGELVRHRLSKPTTPLAKTELLNGWRGNTVGQALDDILAGRSDLRVEQRDDGLSINTVPRS